MKSNWCLEVQGEYACFTRPEMKVERVSYDVMTPSAARAIFEAILWKPAILWHVTKIEVLRPIRWISVRRNEVAYVIPKPTKDQCSGNKAPPPGIAIEEYRQQRAGLFLRDVKYRMHAFFEFIPPDRRPHCRRSSNEDETEAKYAAMFERRAKKGQCYHRPYLGCREFSCDFRLIDLVDDTVEQPIQESRDLGFMLYDMDFTSEPNEVRPLFFRATLQQGVVVTDRRKIEVRG